jgi:RES domain-containing protein
MRLYRIGSTGPSWRPEDISGAGAARSPGRWNREGELVVYAAPTLAMAVLETAAHIDDGGLPLNRYVVEIDVPQDVWAARTHLASSTLSTGWDAVPHGIVSIERGSHWYTDGESAVLELPSIIVPEESIVLINATHVDASRCTSRAVRLFEYSRLFRPSK